MSPRASTLRAPAPASASGGPLRVIRRQCECGAHAQGGTCEACQKKRTVRRFGAGGPAATGAVPSSVGEALSRPGRRLEPASRAFLEPRFGRDFSQVRVHTDAGEGRSAREIQAQAYTVGQHIVFAPGHYDPHSERGRRLLTHEVAHTVQQGNAPLGSLDRLTLGDPSDAHEREADRFAEGAWNTPLGAAPPRIQRACLAAAECGKDKDTGSLDAFVAETEADPANKSKADQRKADCKKPKEPKCTAGGHGARAAALEKLLKGYDPTRLTAIKGIFVDKDIPAQYGAYTWECNLFTPSIAPSGKCTFVPEGLEAEAKQFNDTMDATIGGLSRDDWRDQTLETLSHETGHARFDTDAKFAKPRPSACSFASVQAELSELAAIMNGYETFFYLLQNSLLTEAEKEKRLHDKLEFFITNPMESIAGTLHKMRCLCDCADVDSYVKKTVEFVTVAWSQAAKDRFHLEMHSSEWASSDLRWPIPAPPPKPAAPLQLPPATVQPPQPARPKFGPLFKPRTDFNKEILKSAEDL